MLLKILIHREITQIIVYLLELHLAQRILLQQVEYAIFVIILYFADEFHSLYPVNNAPSKCVLSVHGLDPIIMTHARIFNLLCVFGNVAKVCILKRYFHLCCR